MPRTAPADLAARVERDRLMQTTTDLAQWEKLSGSRDERRAFDYVQSLLDGFGYRTRIIEHDAYISLPGRARLEVGGSTPACITHSHARATGPGGVSGAVVDLGEGAAADFRGRDLAGKVLLIEGIAKPSHADLARDAGAVGQIHISPGGLMHEMCVSPVWGNPSAETLALLPATAVVTIGREDGLALRARLGKGETLTATIHAEVDTGWRTTPILEAELHAPGAGADAPFVLFSGHIDTWYLGVMDNGTANATMVEVARLVAGHRDEMRRGLRLCFWSGHSHGRYSGSAWYADAFWHDLDARCLAHVNADSTGARGASVLTNSGAAAELRAVAAEAIRAHSGQTHAGRRLARQGDESFWGVGIPAMFGSLSHQPVPADGSPHFHLGYWWHTPEDTLDKIDPENLARDTGIFAHVLWRLLADRLVPLDYAEHARDLVAELRAMPEGLDLAPLVAAAERLGETAGRLADADPDRANAALMAVSRALVPMDSTRGDRFVHDPALGQPGWPVLAPVRALRGAEPGSDAWRFRLVGARQAANRLRHALDLADRALAAAL